MGYAWFVNYLCLVVKISFPWGFSDNDWFKTWRVNFVKICAWNGITVPPLPPSKLTMQDRKMDQPVLSYYRAWVNILQWIDINEKESSSLLLFSIFTHMIKNSKLFYIYWDFRNKFCCVKKHFRFYFDQSERHVVHNSNLSRARIYFWGWLNLSMYKINKLQHGKH